MTDIRRWWRDCIVTQTKSAV